MKGYFRFAFESFGRCVIVIWLMGMYWIVYSNHNPEALKYVWTLRVMSTGLLIWVFIPLYDFIRKTKQELKVIKRKNGGTIDRRKSKQRGNDK